MSTLPVGRVAGFQGQVVVCQFGGAGEPMEPSSASESKEIDVSKLANKNIVIKIRTGQVVQIVNDSDPISATLVSTSDKGISFTSNGHLIDLGHGEGMLIKPETGAENSIENPQQCLEQKSLEKIEKPRETWKKPAPVPVSQNSIEKSLQPRVEQLKHLGKFEKPYEYSRGSWIIKNDSYFKAYKCIISGHGNRILGSDNTITGNCNQIDGNWNKIYGQNNIVYGKLNQNNTT